VHQVVIVSGSDVIARHERSYERESAIFDPLHYLRLLEQKSRALEPVRRSPGSVWFRVDPVLPQELKQDDGKGSNRRLTEHVPLPVESGSGRCSECAAELHSFRVGMSAAGYLTKQ
jgi:hypothetical protein